MVNNRVEKVKKIIQAGHTRVGETLTFDADEVARQIDDYYCQLFPQPLEKCPKCDGSGRVYICIGQMNEFYEKCPDCKGSGKTPQPLDDKELREEIGEIFCKEVDLDYFAPIGREAGDNFTNSILALLQPKIEEAKREERERIITEIENKNLVENVLILNMELPLSEKPRFEILLTPETWQALKGGTNE